MKKKARLGNGKKRASTPSAESPVAKNGWTLYAHPEFLSQLERVYAAAKREADPQGDATKVLAWITRAIFEEIPADPTLSVYRLGGALSGITHWFRDKYAGQFRLFFRYNSRARIIIYGWVNDEETLRAYESKTDAYKEFRKRLGNGVPPDSWEDLLKEASAPEAMKRLNRKRPNG